MIVFLEVGFTYLLSKKHESCIFFCRAWLRISFEQEVLFGKFLDSFIEYNSHTNLSAIRERDDIITKHFVDSIIPIEFISFSKNRILDIWTGGWMPGIPLAIMLPDSHFTLLDSVGKKIKACDHFSQVIWLKNVESIHARAEEFARNHYGQFDKVVSRATAFLPTILEWSLPFLTQNGQIILYKSPSTEELHAGDVFCKEKGIILKNIFEYLIEWQERKILVYEKI